MNAAIAGEVRPTLVPGSHPYVTGPFTFNDVEYDATELEVISEVPRHLSSVYLRNTQNPVPQPLGTHHMFDGDGMLHLLSFQNGRCEYRNRSCVPRVSWRNRPLATLCMQG